MSPAECHPQGSNSSRTTVLTATLGTGDPLEDAFYASLIFLVEGCNGYDTVARWLHLHESTSYADRFHDGAMSWAKSQITRCATKHVHRLTRDFCPTRLLDIDSEPIRLVCFHDVQATSGNAIPLGVQYAALSYCWGDKEQSRRQLVTTKENLQDRLIGIPESELSPILRDAIQATRLLSVRYLWIDSLCILQDDKHDWEHQSATMGEIYQNAYVTIATPASGSCNQGFRYATHKKLYLSFHSQLNADVHGFFSIRYLGHDINMRGYPITKSYICNADSRDSRWRSRGWTFQEELMSTRLLIFGPAEIFFECDLSTSHQCGHTERKEKLGIDQQPHWSHWYWLLHDYSFRY